MFVFVCFHFITEYFNPVLHIIMKYSGNNSCTLGTSVCFKTHKSYIFHYTPVLRITFASFCNFLIGIFCTLAIPHLYVN